MLEGGSVGPFSESGLDEALGLAVGLRSARRVLAEATLGRMRPKTMTVGELVEHISKHFLLCEHVNSGPWVRGDISRIINRLVSKGTPAEANHAHVTMRAVLRFAVAERLMGINPMEGMELPALRGSRSRVLSDDELASAYCAAIRMRFGAFRSSKIDPFSSIIPSPRHCLRYDI